MSQNSSPDLPVQDPLSGPGAPPFYGPPTPPPAGAITLFSGPIHGPSGVRNIGPLIIELTETGSDADIPLDFSTTLTQTVTAPADSTVMVIRPPAANTVGLTLGTDVPISPSNYTEIALPDTNGGHTYSLTAAGPITGAVEVNFA